MTFKLSNIVLACIGTVSVGLAIVSYRYLAGIGPIPPNIARNVYLHPWIGVHALGAATALLLGPFQFWPGLRIGRPKFHRWSGRIYIAGCLVGGGAGLVLAAGTSSGPVAGIGFAVGGSWWLYTTSRGWFTAIQRDWTAHRRWMIRSFALTFSAIPFRIYLLTFIGLGFRQTGAEQIASWLAWAPNVLAAELYLRSRNTVFLRTRPNGPT